MIKLYRAVSALEFEDYRSQKKFRTSKNTLEAKQFFKSEEAVKEFIKDSKKQNYNPSYKYILLVLVDKQCLENSIYEEQELDRFLAITIHEADLPLFNKCIIFVESYDT